MTGIWETNQAVTKKVHFITLAQATLYCTCHCWPKISDVSFLRIVTSKLVPPKIGPAGLILAKNLPKPVSLEHFCCQNWSSWTDFGCQNGSFLPKLVPHGGPILAKNYLLKLVPLKVALLFLRVHGYMDAAIISSYAWLFS